MKRLITAIFATLFAAAVGAVDDSDIYGGFADGNSDLSTGARTASVSALRPGVGDHYLGWGDGNGDLFSGTENSTSGSSKSLDIYHGFADGNSDLQ
jgi:hypothetical protein